MTPETLRVFAFGDQTYDVADSLHQLLRAHSDPIVVDFLERSARTLKKEVTRLSPGQQAQCPRFATLGDLLPHYKAGRLNPALVQAVTCITQLGIFLREHSSGGLAYPTPENGVVTGVCTGALAAVAVGCATSVSSLVPLALFTVAVAARLGAVAWDLGDRINPINASEGADAPFASWTSAVAGGSTESLAEALQQHNADKALSIVAAPYISAHVGASQASVSGPPPALADFLSTLSRPRISTSLSSITAPYHAAHLYSDADVAHVLGALPARASWTSTTIPIISAAEGQDDARRAAALFPDALGEAVRDCLLRRIAIDRLPVRIADHVQSLGKDDAVIHPVANPTAERLGPAIRNLLCSDKTSPPASLSETPPQYEPANAESPAAKSPIAILSASGRFPGRADSMDLFWKILSEGVDTHELVPATRWNAAAHVSENPKAKNVSGTGFGCWLHSAASFDVNYFNMSPREAPQVDPAQRLALLTATEALELAGIVPDRTSSTQKNRVGVYFGCTSNDWMETNSAQNIDTYFIPGGNRAFIPGRINYHFKFSGPSYTIDTACSSSLAALHMACNALWRGEVDTAIVGGTNVLTNPDMHAGLDRGHFLSRTGNCKTFDDDADGYCRGEAVVTMILKRVEDARADKDPIQACILGIATNHSAEAESITRPHVGAQQDLFEHLLAETGVNPNDISYCEMHGTGTQAGDAGESASVLQTLSPLSSSGVSVRPATKPLHIGAAKSNVGHGEAAAGVTSLAKVLLMLKKGRIPKHIGIKTKLNHRLPALAPRNTFIAKEEVMWERPVGGKRTVLLNNFSAAGGNTALILEDAPIDESSDLPDVRKHHIVTVSAKSKLAMVSNLRNMLNWVKENERDASILSKLSYTTTARRQHLRYRFSATAVNLAQVKGSLEEELERRESGENVPSPAKGPGFVFCFTGQGAPYAGMGADLFANYASFRMDITRYDQLCVQMGFPSIKRVFQDDKHFESATPAVLQLAHVCFQMALYRLWLSFGLEPKAVVGHSLGEYAALFAAGSLSQAEVIHLVGKRVELMTMKLSPFTHQMLVARTGQKSVELVLGPAGQNYEFCCINANNNIVLGGTIEQIKDARTRLEANTIRCHVLDTPYSFHSSQVDPILDDFAAVTLGTTIKTPKIPIISPTHNSVLHEASEFGSDYFVKHCRHPVNMLGALTTAKDAGLFNGNVMTVEIGPAPVIVNLIKEIVGPTVSGFASVGKGKDTSDLFTQALAGMYKSGASINWSRYHEDFPGAQHVLELPTYGWELKEYWMQYVHSWSLRKGEPPLIAAPTRLESSSIHEIKTNTLQGKEGELVVEADLTRSDLHPMVQGHKVYGVPLCTPSVYADIALTIGEHVKQTMGDSTFIAGSTVVVADMNIQSALVANANGETQVLRTVAKYDPARHGLALTFSTIAPNGKLNEQHANCLVRIVDAKESMDKLKDLASTAKARIGGLESQLSATSNTFRFKAAMIYKMIGQLADFDSKYRGLVDITLDNDALEAAGTISFNGIANEGKWHTSPAYLDALSQLGGFVMNANEGVDLEKEVFINHGWGALQLFERIDPERTYRSYVKMREDKDKLWLGDVAILDDQMKLVGVVQNVSLQGVPKRLMHYIVTAANKKAVGPGSAPQKQALATTASKPATVSAAVTTATHQSHQSAKTTTKKTKVITSSKPAESPILPQALQMVSEEVGVSLESLTDDLEFADAGLDSLLSLVISSRMRDELGIDFESATFLQVGTIGGLKTFLKALSPPSEGTVSVTETVEQVDSVQEKRVKDTVAKVVDTLWPTALKILAEESGIIEKDLTDDVAFADAGVDSLLSLVICSRLRDELDVDLGERALFQELHTVRDLRQRLSGSSSESDSGVESDASSPPPPDSPITDIDEMSDDDILTIDLNKSAEKTKDPVPTAWSISLQGSPKRAAQILFLFPDGCGAATSYLGLPKIKDSLAVVGFNSPYMKNPTAMHERTLEEVVNSYVTALQTRQPHGPYWLGGWSAGGILAYAVAQQLMAAGEEVSKLVLIDSPAPTKGLDRLPARFFDHCNSVGLFGNEMKRGDASGAPEWLMPHFRAQIELLHDYCAPPMSDAAKNMHVTIVWAGACAFDGVRYAHIPPPATAEEAAEDTEGMKFLSEPRKDLGSGEWAALFPNCKVDVRVMQDEHHFSMMRDNGAQVLGEYLREALA